MYTKYLFCYAASPSVNALSLRWETGQLHYGSERAHTYGCGGERAVTDCSSMELRPSAGLGPHDDYLGLLINIPSRRMIAHRSRNRDILRGTPGQ